MCLPVWRGRSWRLYLQYNVRSAVEACHTRPAVNLECVLPATLLQLSFNTVYCH